MMLTEPFHARLIDIGQARFLSCDFYLLFGTRPGRGGAEQTSQFLRVYL
jgi:hypothetical protein